MARLGARAVVVLVLLPLLYVLWPFWRIRITHFGVDRLGNTACDMQIYRAQMRIRPRGWRESRILLAGNPVNRVLVELFARELPLITARLPSALWHAAKDVIARTRFHAPVYPYSCDDHYEMQLDLPAVRFTAEEEERGRALLRNMGIGPKDWYVCFHARDAAYHKSRIGKGGGAETGSHIRNIDISAFLPLAEAIAAAGGIAVRMGANVERPLPPGLDPRIVDYATHWRSEFGDIFLPSRARFFIGNASGLVEIPHLFGTPAALVSCVTLFPDALGRNSLYAPIRLRWKDSGRDVHLSEAYQLGFFDIPPKKRWTDINQFEALGLEILINEPDDVMDLFLDMMDLTQGVKPPPEAVRLQDIYNSFNADQTSLAEYGPRLGPRFALKYRHLIE